MYIIFNQIIFSDIIINYVGYHIPLFVGRITVYYLSQKQRLRTTLALVLFIHISSILKCRFGKVKFINTGFIIWAAYLFRNRVLYMARN